MWFLLHKTVASVADKRGHNIAVMPKVIKFLAPVNINLEWIHGFIKRVAPKASPRWFIIVHHLHKGSDLSGGR